MITYILINIGTGVMICSALGIAALIRRKARKVSLCDTCSRLVLKGKTTHYDYKYACIRNDPYDIYYFDKPPQYCKYYVPREEQNQESTDQH